MGGGRSRGMGGRRGREKGRGGVYSVWPNKQKNLIKTFMQMAMSLKTMGEGEGEGRRRGKGREGDEEGGEGRKGTRAKRTPNTSDGHVIKRYGGGEGKGGGGMEEGEGKGRGICSLWPHQIENLMKTDGKIVFDYNKITN